MNDKISWKTCDTRESVAVLGSKHKNSGRWVYLLQPDGKEAICSSNYQGDGIWGDVNLLDWFLQHNPKISVFNATDSEISVATQLRLILKVMEGLNTEILFPIKISYNPYAIYEENEASDLCNFNGKDYTEEVLFENGQNCKNCEYFNREPTIIPNFPIRSPMTSCKLLPGGWFENSFCSKFSVKDNIKVLPSLERTFEQKKGFEEHHWPEPWEFEE
jgi:hypothetical protein